ncbi:MAG: tetratricopeptide repeat protein [Pseudomonadota bacterium]
MSSAALSNFAVAADEPTLHQVYQAAEAGKLNEAQDMMHKVLREHPNSAKAHFVEAELLAKQGRFANAETELANAERLAPGLPFAKPVAVQELKTLLAASHAPQGRQQSQVYSTAAAGDAGGTSPGLPWGMIILGAGAIALVVYFVRRSNASQAGYAAGSGRYGSVNPMQQGYGTSAYPQQPGVPAGGGLGSGIMGGLATGAAVGAGIVAGEALMHHFTDSDRRERSSQPYLNDNSAPLDLTRNDDMGGNDFGVTDSSSWDDAGGGGGSNDWDS